MSCSNGEGAEAGSVSLEEPNRISDAVFEEKLLGVVLFAWETFPISSFLVLVLGVTEVSRTAPANQIRVLCLPLSPFSPIKHEGNSTQGLPECTTYCL